jgi:Holliday junction resolvase RusA-like endonuclease
MIANPKYTAFKERMAWAIKMDMIGQRYLPFEGRTRLCLQVSIPPRMDVTAIIKAACDAVQLSGAIADDNQIDILSVERAGKSEGKISTIVFEIEEIYSKATEEEKAEAKRAIRSMHQYDVKVDRKTKVV